MKSFKLILRFCKVGNHVALTSSTGTIEGRILEIDEKEIALETNTGEICMATSEDVVSLKVLPNIDDRASSEPESATISQANMTVPMHRSISATEDVTKPTIISTESVHVSEQNNISVAENKDVKPAKVQKPNATTFSQSRFIPLNQLIEIQWKNVKWREQVYRKLTNYINNIGNYAILEENKKTIPSRGKVDAFKIGIIYNLQTGNKYVYNTNDVLLGGITGNQQVFYEIIDGHIINIIPSYKLSIIIDKIKDCFNRQTLGGRSPLKELRLFGILQKLFPDNQTIEGILQEMKHVLYDFSTDKPIDQPKKIHDVKANVTKNKSTTTLHSEYSPLWDKARQANGAKQHEDALKYCLEALRSGNYPRQCINMTALTYTALYKKARQSESERAEELQLDAIAFMHKYGKELPEETKTWYMQENFYYAVRAFDDFLKVLEKLMPAVKGDPIKLTDYLNKKAAAHIEREEYDLAKKAIDESFSVTPENYGAQKLKDVLDKLVSLNKALKSVKNEEEEKEIKEKIAKISGADYSALTGSGMGVFITQVLEEYTEMEGLSTQNKQLSAKDFDRGTLNNIKGFMVRTGRNRPDLLAKQILTEVKVLQVLLAQGLDLQETGVTVQGEMARYCCTMAELKLNNTNPNLDVVHFYYNQAFMLGLRDARDRFVSAYLQTLVRQPQEIIGRLMKMQTEPIDSLLCEALSGEGLKVNANWDKVLELMLYNKELAKDIIEKIHTNTNLRNCALQELRKLGVSTDNTDSFDEFKRLWEQLREKRINEQNSLITQIGQSGKNYNNIGDISSRLEPQLKDWMKVSWLQDSLDRERLGQILDNVVKQLNTFRTSRGYITKENAYHNVRSQLDKLIDDIKDNPTKISFEAVIPLLNRIRELADNAWNDIQNTSEPKLTISLLSGNTVIDDGNVVALQVSVGNAEASSPVNNVTVRTENANGVTFLGLTNKEEGIMIEGGKQHIFKLKVKVSDEVRRNEVTTLTILCKYADRNGKIKEAPPYSTQLALYSTEDFVKVTDKIYFTGDALDSNDETFVGRESYMNDIISDIEKPDNKKPVQYIIYGQKRCGKSSVWERLADRLEKDGYFCIKFSLQLLQNITEFTFYRTILKQLENALRVWHRKDKNTPQFKAPTNEEFVAMDTLNPANSFITYMAQFRDACYPYPAWRDRKLVLMIDEFTYIYGGIEDGTIHSSIMRQWKAITQDPNCNFSVILVGQDVTPTFLGKEYASNAMQVIKKKRLTYLSETEARELIEKPMTKAWGASPYIGNAVERIIEYTSRNPFYIQNVCIAIIEYMNEHKLKKVTEADIDEVAANLHWEESDFDNLLNGGENEKIAENKQRKAERMELLKAIARLSTIRGYDYCSLNDILTEIKCDGEDLRKRKVELLEELKLREVLAKEGEDSYKIQVKLFRQWLYKPNQNQ